MTERTMTPFDLASTPLVPGTTLIEASAGTGKTYAIVGLCVRLIAEHGVRIDEIVVTTFTIPATAELRQRIRAALLAAARALETGASTEPYLLALCARGSGAESAIMAERIAAAVRDFDQAIITTIHGLCQRLLRDQAFESGMLFDTEFLADQSPMIREIADDFWRTHFYAGDPLLTGFALADEVGPGTLAKLLEMALAQPNIEVRPSLSEGELARCRGNVRQAFEALRATWQREEAELRRSFAPGSRQWSRKPYNVPDVMERHLDALAACLQTDGEIEVAHLDLDVFDKSECETARRRGDPHAAPLSFFDACENLRTARDQWRLALRTQLIRWGTDEMARRKQQANVMSFDDLLTRLQAALVRPGGAALIAKIRARFRAALIDEFQDTDRVQDAIFARLFGGPDFFRYLIGDPKQAIYAFRGADVFAYCAAGARADAQFTLIENHRSSRSFLEAINLWFERRNAFLLEGISYRAVHGSGRADQSPFRIGGAVPAPLQLALWTAEKPVTKKEAETALPGVVAAQIGQLLEAGATVGDRPLLPSDIAVLVARNRDAHRVQAALRELNIPSVLLGNASVFKTEEATDLRAVLAAIAMPSREPLLRAALATTILGATAAALDTLLADTRAWETRVLRFQQYHEEWRAHGFMRMFRRFLREEEVRVRILGFPDGERRLTNLLHIAELMHCASMERRLGIAGLLKWLSDRCAAEGVTAEEHELRLETDRDAVHVVTMHKSKGLEYNVVFCPYLWRATEARNVAPVVIHDPSRGHHPVLELQPTPADYLRAATERLAEDVRLLYVAMTRARYRCAAIWGRFNRCEHSAANWLLHGRTALSDLPPKEFAERVKTLPSAQFELAAKALAEQSGGTVDVVPIEFVKGARIDAFQTVGPVTAARVFTGTIPRDWRIASFSSLTAGGDAEQPDFDRVASPTLPEEPILAEGIHAFPRGPKAGVCLHQIFETIDFQAEAEGEVASRLASFGYDRPELRAAVSQCVRHTLRTLLPGGFSLEEVPRSAQLREVEFTFPFSRIEARALTAIFGALPLQAGALHFEPQRGFLRGFIDLVVEHAGRFYLVDWKSNWLGPHGSSYTAEAVEAEMRKHHYHLQYSLYAAALDRFLRWRLPGFDYDAHFGGVCYLFLRGLDPAHPGRGVFHDRPDRSVIAALNALFDRGPGA